MIRVLIHGAAGHMGQILTRSALNDPEVEIAGLVDAGAQRNEAVAGAAGGTSTDPDHSILSSLEEFTGEADVVIDFSHHAATEALTRYCVDRNLPLVLCTTGQTEEEEAAIQAAAQKVPIFRSGNMSVGIAILTKLVAEAAAKMAGDIEILEVHHRRKLDAPSGTALMLAEAARRARPQSTIKCGRSGHEKREANEIGIQSIRMGNIPGTHEVMIGTDTQTITLKHEAHDRGIFADGALDAAKFLAGKPAGLYNMDDLLGQ